MDISNLLKTLRVEKGLSQARLAKVLGITQDSISLWENGKRFPDTQYITKLADFFGVSTDYLLGRSDELGYVTMQNFPAPPALSNEETELLARFREMDRAQKVRVMAYCEGMSDANRSKYKA